MAGPLAGIATQVAQQAQQKLPDQAAQVNKQGPSKFDGAMKGANHAQAPQSTQHVDQAQKLQEIDKAKQIEQANKIDKTAMNKADLNRSATGKMDPVSQKSEVSKSKSMLMGMVDNLEKGQVDMDKLLNSKNMNFSTSDLLKLQAGMHKYTLELDLTSKVVEKATGGLKETLKTQV
jgi:hypothetical protein